MRLSAEEVRRVADLARLDLAPDEAETLAAQLGALLERIEGLEEGAAAADSVPAVAATGGPGDDAAPGDGLRADEPAVDPLAADPSSFAPAWGEGFFTVPRLASHGGARAEEEAS